MQAVWKFAIRPGQFTLALPDGAQPLSVQLQGGEPYMWVLVDPAEQRTPRTFRCAGTGHEIADGPLMFIGTFQQPDLGLVWHLFEQP